MEAGQGAGAPGQDEGGGQTVGSPSSPRTPEAPEPLDEPSLRSAKMQPPEDPSPGPLQASAFSTPRVSLPSPRLYTTPSLHAPPEQGAMGSTHGGSGAGSEASRPRNRGVAPADSKFMIDGSSRGSPDATRVGHTPTAVFRVPSREEQYVELENKRRRAEERSRASRDAIQRRLQERLAWAREAAARHEAEAVRRRESLERAEDACLRRRLGILQQIDEKERRASAFQERRRAELAAARERSRAREEEARRAVALADELYATRSRVAALLCAQAVERARAEQEAQDYFWASQGFSEAVRLSPDEEMYNGRIYKRAPRIYRGEGAGEGACESQRGPQRGPVRRSPCRSPRESPHGSPRGSRPSTASSRQGPRQVPLFLDEEPLIRASERLQARHLLRSLTGEGALPHLFSGLGGGPKPLADGRTMLCAGGPALSQAL